MTPRPARAKQSIATSMSPFLSSVTDAGPNVAGGALALPCRPGGALALPCHGGTVGPAHVPTGAGPTVTAIPYRVTTTGTLGLVPWLRRTAHP